MCPFVKITCIDKNSLLCFCFFRFVNSMVYYGLSLNTSNLGGNDYVNFFIAGAVEIPAYLFCQISLQYVGRRKSLSGTMVVGGLSLLLIPAVPKRESSQTYMFPSRILYMQIT